MISFAQGSGSPTAAMQAVAGELQYLIDSMVAQNSYMGERQLQELLTTYFVLEEGKKGSTVYVPKTIQVKMDRTVIVENAGVAEEQIIVQTLEIPLITLASINWLQIKGAETMENGGLKVQIGEMPLPKGLIQLIEMLSQSIVPRSNQ